MAQEFSFSSMVTAVCDPQMDQAITRNLWRSFSLTASNLELMPGKPNTFIIGHPDTPDLPQGKEYVLSVSENGVYILGANYGGLMRGFFSLLMKIRQQDDHFLIDSTQEQSHYNLQNRMIHICVFPENDLYFIKKLIRLTALCQYTHIVIEFWGMLKYDCLKELAWPQAFTKDQARELITECRSLGMEPIPMFNQLGHATASRVCYGKHVVLDQNPLLQRLFTPDGWAWDITSDEVFSLLAQVRSELYELFGDGEYMHIGCDEAYYITRNETIRKELPAYLAKLTKAVEAEGKRPMLWMDMLLEENVSDHCYTTGNKEEVSTLRNSTAASTVFVDWQYDCTDTPIPTLASLKDCGHDTMGAPWFNEKNYAAHIQTVVDYELFGVMLTTWHLLKMNLHSILGCAKEFGAKSFYWSEFSGLREETATLLRRVSFEGNSYADAGWSKEQIEV